MAHKRLLGAESRCCIVIGGDDMNDIVNAISTVGFPIALCVFLVWQNSKQDNYFREILDKLRETVERNTNSITELAQIIKNKEEKQ